MTITRCQECRTPIQVPSKGYLPLCSACKRTAEEGGYEVQKAAWDKFKAKGMKYD